MIKHKILNSGITCASPAEVASEIITKAKQKHPIYVCFANVHMVTDAFAKKDFQQIVNSAHMAVPDGKPVAILMNLLYDTRQTRVAGPEMMVEVMRQANEQKLSVYFYGSTEEVLAAMREKLNLEYPNMAIAGMVSPPFRTLTPEEEQADVEAIRQSGAHIVLVGLGCPKQEQWMYRNYQQLPAVLLGVGAAFPFFTGQVKRAPQWMQQAGLEWLYRIYAEPRRLFMRYLVTNSLFLLYAARQFASQSFQKKTASPT